MNRGCCISSPSRWARRASLRCSRAGSPPRPGGKPFTVYGLLRTVDAASPLAAPAVASSLIAFVIVYFAVFATGVTYLLRMMAAPPHQGEEGPRADVPARAAGITPAAGAAR